MNALCRSVCGGWVESSIKRARKPRLAKGIVQVFVETIAGLTPDSMSVFPEDVRFFLQQFLDGALAWRFLRLAKR